MSIRSTARTGRRRGVAVALAAGLSLAGPAVVDAAPAGPVPSAPTSVIGLKYGDTGPLVTALQRALIRVGVGVVGGVDGVFGSATRASVRAWQNHRGLPVTGVVDQATAQSLGLLNGTNASSSPAATATTSSSGVLQVGSRGRRVAQLQLALINRGYVPTGGVDGIFGPATQAQLRRFQQANGLAATGTGDAATMAALGASTATTTSSGAAATSTASNATSYVGLRLGSRGPLVQAVQQAIIRAGWVLPGGADGIFGPGTQRVVRAVQHANGLIVTGAINPATLRVLGMTGTAAAPAPAQPVAAQPTPAQPAGTTAAGFASYDERGARVVALQQALIRAGIALRGGADGVFGSATAGAIVTFQRQRGLSATGKVDAATASALGLSAMGAPQASTSSISVALEAKPVQGPCTYGDTFLANRGNGRQHLGVDIGAAQGQQVYAVATGRVIQIYRDAPGSLAGNGLKIQRADGTYFFYGHLLSLAPGIDVGVPVTAGQLVGYVGMTGNAAIPHLHLEIHPGGGSAVNPYPIVKAIGAC